MERTVPLDWSLERLVLSAAVFVLAIEFGGPTIANVPQHSACLGTANPGNGATTLSQ